MDLSNDNEEFVNVSTLKEMRALLSRFSGLMSVNEVVAYSGFCWWTRRNKFSSHLLNERTIAFNSLVGYLRALNCSFAVRIGLSYSSLIREDGRLVVRRHLYPRCELVLNPNDIYEFELFFLDESVITEGRVFIMYKRAFVWYYGNKKRYNIKLLKQAIKRRIWNPLSGDIKNVGHDYWV